MILDFYFIHVYMGVVFMHMQACRCLRRPKGNVGLELQVVVSHWELNRGPLQEQYVLLTSEPCF